MPRIEVREGDGTVSFVDVPDAPHSPKAAASPPAKLGETDRAAEESERQRSAANDTAAQKAEAAARTPVKTLGEGEAELLTNQFLVTSKQGTPVEMNEPPTRFVKSVGEGEADTVRFAGVGGVEVAEPTRIVGPGSSGRTDIEGDRQEALDRAARIEAAEKKRIEAEQPIRLVDGQLIVDLSKAPPKGATPVIANLTPATPEETARANRALLGIIPVVGTVIGGVELAKTWDQLSTSEKVKLSGLEALSIAGDLLIVGQGASLALRAVSSGAKAGAAGKVAAETVLTVGKADEAAGFAAQAAKTSGGPVSLDVIAANGSKAVKDLQTVIDRNPALSEVRVITGSPTVGAGKGAIQAAEEVAAAQAARTGVKSATIDIRSAVPEFKTTAGKLPNPGEIKAADNILGELDAARIAKAAEIAKDTPALAKAQAEARAALEAGQANVTKLRQASAPATEVNAAAAKVPKLADEVAAANARVAEAAAAADRLKTPTSVVMVVERTPTPTEIGGIVKAVKESDNIKAIKIEHDNPFKNTAADIKFKAVNDAIAKIAPDDVRVVKVGGKDVNFAITRQAFDAVGDVANKSVPEIVKELRPVSGRALGTVEKGWGAQSPTGKAVAAAEKNAGDFQRGVDKLAGAVQRGGVAAERAGAKPFLKIEKIDTSVTVKPKPGEVETIRRIRIEGDAGGSGRRQPPRGELPKDGGGGRVAVATRPTTTVRAVSGEAGIANRVIRSTGTPRPRAFPVTPLPGRPLPRLPEGTPGQPLRATPPARQPQPIRQPGGTPVAQPGTGPARQPGTGPTRQPKPTTGPGGQPTRQPGPTTGPGGQPTRQPEIGIGRQPGADQAPGPEPVNLPDPEFQPRPIPAPEPIREKQKIPEPVKVVGGVRVTRGDRAPVVPRKQGPTVLRFKSPPGKPIPQQVAFGQGVVENRVFLQSGKRVSTRDLSSAIPNVPNRKPAETFIIEKFGKSQIKSPTVISSGVTKAVIDPVGKTITFLPRKKVDLT